MKTILFAVSVCSAVVAFAAKPTISSFSVTNDVLRRTVTATYDLDVPAVVTALVETNESGDWAPLAGANSIAGANHKVAAGEGKTVTWALGKDFPGRTYDANTLRLTVKAWDLEMPPDWMVVDPTCSNQAYYACKEMIPGGITNFLYKSRYIVFRKIPAKGVVFRMGSGVQETAFAGSTEEPPHLVTFTNDWYMAIYECTQAQWMKVKNTTENPSYWAANSDYNTTDCPVEYISLNRINTEFIVTLKTSTGIAFDLPTEAQWEYSCRAGCGDTIYSGHDLDNKESDEHMDKIAWNLHNSAIEGTKQPHPVGLKDPNAFDMYDILGNIREWTRDCYHDTYGLTAEQIAATATTPVVDPCVISNPGFGTFASTAHIKRGGNYTDTLEKDRCGGQRRAHNDNANLEYGFRVWAPAIVK